MNNLSSLDLECSVFVWLQCHPREVHVDVACKNSLSFLLRKPNSRLRESKLNLRASTFFL